MSSVRAMAHVHSEWSYDGSWKLEDLSRRFAQLRCNAVLMTEHDRGFDESRWQAYREACARASAYGALLVPGIEYSDPGNRVHLLVWGSPTFLGAGRAVRDTLAAVTEAGAVAVLAHPGRREAWRLCDAEWAAHLAGVEIWNRKYDGMAPSSVAFGLLNGDGRLLPFVGTDFHTARQFFPLTLELELPPGSALSECAVFDALKEGRCRPRALGFPAVPLSTRSAPRMALAGLERTRRRAAVSVRRAARSRPRAARSRP